MTTILGIDEIKLAECVGLWLAEGDNKSDYEITITNNCKDIIYYFHSFMNNTFQKIRPRIYIYKTDKDNFEKFELDNVRYRYYKDNRANKNYYIYRIADTKLVKIWHKLVEKVKTKKYLYSHILRGFFAGEGNVKTGKHANRTLRIAQKCRIAVIDNILSELKIDFKFSQRERAYVITGRSNWEKLAKIGVADLNSIKKEKFWKAYNSFKEWHYSRNHIKNNILSYIETPKTSSRLGQEFKRERSRIQHVLTKLKSEGKVENFRVGSKDYWIKTDSNAVLISRRKKKILDFLNEPRKISDISKQMNICWKAAYRRLKELERLNLVNNKNYLWYKIPTTKEVKVI